jgi:hypothetical protein
MLWYGSLCSGETVPAGPSHAETRGDSLRTSHQDGAAVSSGASTPQKGGMRMSRRNSGSCAWGRGAVGVRLGERDGSWRPIQPLN